MWRALKGARHFCILSEIHSPTDAALVLDCEGVTLLAGDKNKRVNKVTLEFMAAYKAIYAYGRWRHVVLLADTRNGFSSSGVANDTEGNRNQ